MRSDEPNAVPFRDRVVREVLIEMAPGEVMPLPASFTDALRQHAATPIKPAEEQEAHARTSWGRPFAEPWGYSPVLQ